MVQFKDLRPAATPRPSNFIRKELPAIGKLVMWEDDNHLKAGVVMDRDEHARTLTVHEHSATTTTSLYWLPLWVSEDGSHCRSKKRPYRATAKEMKVTESDVLVTGTLTDTYTMSSATKKEALAKMTV